MAEDDKGRLHPASGHEAAKVPAPPRAAPVPDRAARPADAERPSQSFDARAGESVSAFTAEQLATPATSMVGHRQMWIIVGPYRGTVLTMPDAEAEDAKDSHWAVEMSMVAHPFDHATEPDHDHELTDEDRAHAIEAANAWAAKVNAPPDPPADPPPEGGARRALTPERGGDYQTRAPTRR